MLAGVETLSRLLIVRPRGHVAERRSRVLTRRWCPCPGTRPARKRLPVTAQLAGAFPGAVLAAAGRQQPGYEQHQFPGDVESDTIEEQGETPSG
jgi:hypothetical protein